jgi:hypothetical protein
MLPFKIVQCHARFLNGTSGLICRLPVKQKLRSYVVNPGELPFRVSSCLTLQNYSTEVKKQNLQISPVKSRELIQDVLQKKKLLLQERKENIVKDIRDKKTRVEEVIERENIFTIPNLLCVGRIVMSPYLGYVIIEGDFSLAMGLMIAAGLTDLVSNF